MGASDTTLFSIIERVDLKPDKRVNMIALAKIGKTYIIGRNNYLSKPKEKFGYPSISGIHAELDLYRKIVNMGFEKEKIDFIFVFGRRGEYLRNTKPCVYCANIFRNLKFKQIVYFQNGNLVKKSKKEFFETEVFKEYY